MSVATLNITYLDAYGKSGVFSALIDAVYDDGVYAEILAFLQDLVDASQAQITKCVLAKPLSLATLTSNSASSAGSYDRIDDQGILSFRSAAGLDIKISVPAPVDALFMAAGAFAAQDVDPAGAEVVALIATGVTEPLLAAKTEDVLTFRKGWRKGQKHS